MSPKPQVRPGSTRRLTKNSPPPRIGVGQKSSAVELTGSPRFCGAPQGASLDSRRATQMSMSVLRSPSERGRVEAMYRLRPSGDWIGQPSCTAVFSSLLVPNTLSALTAGAQGENSVACAAGANTANSASAASTRWAAAAPLRVIAGPFRSPDRGRDPLSERPLVLQTRGSILQQSSKSGGSTVAWPRADDDDRLPHTGPARG